MTARGSIAREAQREARRRWTRMLKGCGALLAALALATPDDVAAQGGVVDGQCRAVSAAERVTQDACQKALDLFQFMAPQLGATLTAGNAVIGEHSTLRGLGHFSIGLRANAMEAALPRVDQRTPALTGVTSSDYAVEKQWIAAPVVDAAVGLFRGFPLAGTYALGLDALVNVSYIPSVDASDLAIDVPDGSLKFGFGGRLGLLQETFVTPGISVTFLARDLPTLDVVGRVSGDNLDVRNVQVKNTAWRVVAGKNLAVLGIAVGAGQDSYDTRADAQVTINRVVPSVTSSVVAARQEVTRTNVFANLSLNLPMVRMVAEVGRANGGTIDTYNTFIGQRADDARSYASLGLRVTW